MNKRAILTVLTMTILVLLVLAQMAGVGEASLARGKPPTKTPRPTGPRVRPSAGCGQTPPTAIGQTETILMVFDGLDRKYNVHLPPSYDLDTPLSLVLSIHGYGGSAENNETSTTLLSPHADANGYVVAYPEAYPFADGSGGFVYTWNDLACNSSPGPDGPICALSAYHYPQHPCATGDCNYCGCQDDIGYIDAMLDEIENNYCIDLNRVYATGFSTGGMFTHRLGCALPDRFAAIAPMHGFPPIGFNCTPGTPLAIMDVWGTRDRIVPADGSKSSDGYYYTTLDDVMAAWGSDQGCDAAATSYTTVSDGVRSWTCTQRANCDDGAEVVSCSWRSPHWYPKTKPGEAFGNDAMWEFFSKHSK